MRPQRPLLTRDLFWLHTIRPPIAVLKDLASLHSCRYAQLLPSWKLKNILALAFAKLKDVLIQELHVSTGIYLLAIQLGSVSKSSPALMEINQRTLVPLALSRSIT